MFQNWGPAEWLGLIAILLPLFGGLAGGMWKVFRLGSRALQHLGAIVHILGKLEAWMQAFGESHADLKARVDRLEKRVDFHGALLFGNLKPDDPPDTK